MIDKEDNKNKDLYKIAVVGNSLLIKSMRLVGIKHAYDVTDESAENIEKIIQEVVLNNEIGIVVVNEGIVEKIANKRLVYLIDSSLKPIFIEIPDYNKPEQYTDVLKRLIIRAIGIDISKK